MIIQLNFQITKTQTEISAHLIRKQKQSQIVIEMSNTFHHIQLIRCYLASQGMDPNIIKSSQKVAQTSTISATI